MSFSGLTRESTSPPPLDFRWSLHRTTIRGGNDNKEAGVTAGLLV